MNKISITSENMETFTTISNLFIDTYMTEAKGEYVKVYLYLLRLMQAGRQVSTKEMAQHFDISEKELCNALRYWIKMDVLRLNYDGKILKSITLLPMKSNEDDMMTEDPFETMAAFQSEQDAKKAKRTTKKKVVAIVPEETPEPEDHSVQVPDKRELSATDLQTLARNEDFSQLMYLIETYCGKSLTQTDLRILAYIYDDLQFSTDLLEYLIEYCVTNNKKSLRYMEKVAIDWYENEIRTVADAKARYAGQTTLYKTVLNALNIRRQAATAIEKNYIDTWFHTYGFDESIILEACNRAVLQRPATANFPYVNGIIESWHKHNVKSLADIQTLDQAFYDQKSTKKKTSTVGFVPASDQDNSESDDIIRQLNSLIMEG